MSKFLFVSSFDLRRNTSGNIRVVALMKSLHDSGHTVHCIFIPSEHNSDKDIYDNLVKIDRLFTFPKRDIKFVKQGALDTSIKMNSFLYSCRLWLIHLYMKFTVYDVYALSLYKLKAEDLKDLDDSYDYIVSSAEPRSSHSFAGKIIKMKKYKSKWIQYWGDPMSNDVASTKLFHNKEAKEERRLISLSDCSIYTNPCAVSYMKDKYPELASRINWIPTTDFNRHICERGDVNLIGYFGDYRQKYRNLAPFYQACCENHFNSVIIGSADQPFISTDTVKVYERMSRAEISKFEKDCGILIVLENICKSGNCIQVPGKLYHYGLTYKKIVVITESTNILREYNKYKRFVFVPNNKKQIAEVIQRIQTEKDDNIDASPVEEFKNNNIVDRFINIIQ